MSDASLAKLPSLQSDFIKVLLSASNSSDLKETIENLVGIAKTDDGRADLASKDVLPAVLQLISHSLNDPHGHEYLLLSLKLLRNLCAGEIGNQISFIEVDGVGILSTLLRSRVVGSSDPDCGIIRLGLQVLANVALAGKEHQQAIWDGFFHDLFFVIAKVQSRQTCDPLCMIIYVCCDGSPELVSELCGDQGMPILTEIVQTASSVDFGEDWLKLLLSRICLEEIHLPNLFSELHSVNSENSKEVLLRGCSFLKEQAYLLNVVSEILRERLEEIIVPIEFASFIFGIFKKAVENTDFDSRGQSGLPTGSAVVDVLGYSLTILRDICAINGQVGRHAVDVVDALLSSGLLELLLCLLRELEPPAIIRKAMAQAGNQEASTSYTPKLCPYKGFRRDIVAAIGNCSYRRKHIQDTIRQKNWILLMLQQCVTDDYNPYLREWGIWSMRNLLEGNSENQQAVAELELQGSVDMPELTGLGLRAEVDKKTGKAKLVNIS